MSSEQSPERPAETSVKQKPSLPKDGKKWQALLRAYETPNAARSLLEIALTLSLYTALWFIAVQLVSIGWWASLPVSILMAGVLTRIFILFHDCAHGSLFAENTINEFFGHITGILTATPYNVWQSSHLAHHSVLGHQDRRKLDDISTMTIDEFKNAGRYDKFIYRLERNWMVRFTFAPALLFVCYYRFPLPEIKHAAHIKSVIICNIGFVGFVGSLILLIGLKPFLIIYIPAVIIAAATGSWLTYVHHQFEGTVWMEPDEWNFQDSALYGSSYYELPAFLRWLTGDVGVHHVHHLCSRIPFYRLKNILKDYPELKEINHLTIRDSLKTIQLNIWDDDKNKLVSFRESGL